MRERKFKFWNTDEKKMYGEFEFEDLVSAGGFNDNGIWLEWTGLLDKNGKEIFEGDVVVFSSSKKPYLQRKRALPRKHIVEYEEFGFKPFTDSDFDGEIYYKTKDCEIIGNIYENPDLLKETNAKP